MKWMIWSITLSLTPALLVNGQEGTAGITAPSSAPASLGIPRASLGIPVRSDEGSRSIKPLENSGKIFPASYNPVSRGQSEAPALPYPFTDAPSPMPKDNGDVGGKTDSKSALPQPNLISPPQGSITSFPADLEAPLCQLPLNAPPFINQDRFRFSAEYLAWWTTGMNVPTLVSTGPSGSNGIIGAGGTAVFGNGSLGSDFHSGVRFGTVWWCDPCQRWGIDGSFFYLAQSGQTVSFRSAGDPLLARPFTNANTGSPFSELVAFPGALAGNIGISTTTSLWGADLNARRKLWTGSSLSLDGLIGYRYLHLSDTLTIQEQSARTTALPAPVATDPSTQILRGTALDQFRSTNQFNGGQIGTILVLNRGRWVVDLRTTVAIGATTSSVDITGAQINTFPTGNVASSGGLLALNSNIGHHTRSDFAIVPELNLNVGYNLTQHCRLFVGYSLMGWSSVVRAGDQVDTTLDVSRIPNFPLASPASSVHPVVPLRDRNFVVQGLNLGIMLRW